MVLAQSTRPVLFVELQDDSDVLFHSSYGELKGISFVVANELPVDGLFDPPAVHDLIGCDHSCFSLL